MPGLTSLTPRGLASFGAFWPYYVMEHADPRNRRLHFVGTALTFVFVALAVADADALWLIGMPVAGYGFAWFGHFFVQHNRPATFTYPVWSLIADYRMFFLACAGRMGRVVAEAEARFAGRDAG